MDILQTEAYFRKKERHSFGVLLFSLLPFLLSSGLYFYLWLPESSPSPHSAAVKCIPVLTLSAMLFCHKGCSLGHPAGKLLSGLLMSAVGDVCLIWKDLLLPGVAFFSLAHILYSLSFLSTRSRRPSWLLLPCLVLWIFTGCTYMYILPHLQVRPDAQLMVPAVGFYCILITIMTSFAFRTTRPPTIAGSLFFMASDFILAHQLFVAPAPWGRMMIMITYYLAQLLIAVGGALERQDYDLYAGERSKRKKK
ncbi:lysoplasmalogenase [Polypterus senegalus]|uniref:lysoplasmalogenase n=1 Tax=Polypterus senegalus TaxID=55291 RepID=UPI001963F86F|nr:lysoplasmalogenase [Polypterus senegalus]